MQNINTHDSTNYWNILYSLQNYIKYNQIKSKKVAVPLYYGSAPDLHWDMAFIQTRLNVSKYIHVYSSNYLFLKVVGLPKSM